MKRTVNFVEDPNKGRRIRTLRRVWLMLVREIIDIKVAGWKTQTYKCFNIYLTAD